MPVVPFAKTGTAPEDTAWDWSADTQNKILGPDGDNWTQYKAAVAWWDGSTGDDAAKKAPYKLPHHRLGDSGLEAVWHGVSNAVARLEQSSIPEADMKPVFEHLTKHYAQWEKTPPEWDRFIAGVRERRQTHTRTESLASTRALVTVARPHGVPTDDDMRLINQQARTPLAPEQVYIIPASISNQNVDAYFTRMTSQSLKNFADGATSGVAMCDSHAHYQMPIGRSYYGEVAQGINGMETHTLAYMVRGMQLPGSMKSDDYITGMESGIYQDVSIGFIPDVYTCSICGLNMLTDPDCPHWPGQLYAVKGMPDQQCIADVDARLAEFSLVYDGATPNAMLLKAEREIELGRASTRQLRFVEDRCRIKLFDRYPGYTPKNEDDDMKGTDFIRGIMTRSGKAISADNMAKLQAIHDNLADGHNTMDDAMQAMRAFLADNDDGTNKNPDNEPGDGEDDADTNAAKQNGEDQGDAHDPKQPNPPGSDDGDGDNDSLPPVHPISSEQAGRSQVGLTREQQKLIAIGQQAQKEAIATALAAGVRAMGSAFDEAMYRRMLERSTYDEIVKVRANWQELARQQLSPVGTFTPDDNVNGGGTWSDEATRVGGRQTLPRDPNNPIGLTGREAPRSPRRVTDPSFYTTSKKR